MKLSQQEVGDVTVFSLSGEFMTDTVGHFEQEVKKSLATQKRDYVVNLKGVKRIDSIGLEALTWLQRQCEEELGMVKLCGVDETLAKILEMTRLDQQFAVHESVEQATASFE